MLRSLKAILAVLLILSFSAAFYGCGEKQEKVEQITVYRPGQSAEAKDGSAEKETTKKVKAKAVSVKAPATKKEKMTKPKKVTQTETTTEGPGVPSAISYITKDGHVKATSKRQTMFGILDIVRKFSAAKAPQSPGDAKGKLSISYQNAVVLIEYFGNGTFRNSGKWYTVSKADAAQFDKLLAEF